MSWIHRSKNILSQWVKQGEVTPELEQEIREFIVDIINALPEPSSRNFSELTYMAAIGYFTNRQPHHSAISKGAILRQKVTGGTRIIQVFLDEHNELVYDARGNPYGRQVFVDHLDQELEEAFGRSDVIIVE
jgi:hypothetical protein